jgi:hypothetical protein
MHTTFNDVNNRCDGEHSHEHRPGGTYCTATKAVDFATQKRSKGQVGLKSSGWLVGWLAELN